MASGEAKYYTAATSQANAIISNLSHNFDVLQSDSCALPCKDEVMQNLRKTIRLLECYIDGVGQGKTQVSRVVVLLVRLTK